MKHLTLAKRMYLTLIPLALMGVFISLITATSLRENATPLIQAQELKELALTSLSLLLTQDDATKTMMLDPDNPTSNMRKIQAYDANQKIVAKIKGLSASADVRDTIDRMSDLDSKILRDLDTRVLEAVGDGKVDQAKSLYFGTYEPQRAKYETYVKRLVALSEVQSNAAAVKLQSSNASSLKTILGALLAGLVVVAACLAYVARSIAARMNYVVSHLNQEYAAAQDSTNLMTAASRSLSEGLSSTSLAIQDIDGSVSEFASRLKLNDEHAGLARESSAKAVQNADYVSDAISRLVEATKEAQKSSDRVLGVIKVINEISFKTNLLALNASIEAARAGAAGAGFSVVADEVRTLAKNSADAAQQTADLVHTSVQKTKQGYEISEDAARAIAITITEAHRIHGVIDQIASNSHLQNENIQQITKSLTHIGEIGHKSSQDAERTHLVAETLHSRSHVIEEMIGQLVELVGAAG
jgi:methyl-accepting chemotaxis protein